MVRRLRLRTVGRGEKSVIYNGLGDFSNWDEDIYAGYANFVHVKPAHSIEAGLRAERTNVAYSIPGDNAYYAGSDAYDYFELFPNAKFTRQVTARTRVVAA